MTKYEFISEIKKELGFLPQSDIEAAEQYFNSYFAGTESDEDIIARLGNPKDAAKNYYSANILPRVSGENVNAGPAPVKKRGNIWIIVVVLIVLSPVLIPLAILLGGLAAAIIMSVIGVYLVLLVSGIAVWFGGAATAISGLFARAGLANTALQCGIGFLMFGIGLALTLLMVFIAFKFIPWLIRKIADFGSKRIKRRSDV